MAIFGTLIGVSAWWRVKEGITPALGLMENMRIEIKVEREVLLYQETLFWSRGQFLEIMKNRDEFRHTQIGRFNQMYDVSADNFDVSFDEEKKLTVLKCNIRGQFK